MDRRERLDSLQEALLAALDGRQSEMWTAMPGIIREYAPATMTCTVQLAIKMNVREPKGEIRFIEVTPLINVPVIFPNGGGFSLTFPIKPGDECLVIFAARCIDFWWQNGGVQLQGDHRMHDINDGFALVGARSQPRKLSPAPNAGAVQLRSDDGAALVAIEANKNITLTTPGTLTINAAAVQINAPVTATGNVIGDGISLKTHTHPGVQPGGASTGAPNP